jgi:NarL family two-component system response regulator LiaR
VTLVDRLHQALELADPADTATQVHDLVARTFETLDPTLEVKRTDYFTHSFVPDLVLRWDASEAPQERHVHLRFSVSSVSFAEDMKILGSDGSIFVGMTALGEPEPTVPSLDSAARGTLVMQVDALAEFAARCQKQPRVRSGLRPLIRLGHGGIDVGHATRLGERYVDVLHEIADLSRPSRMAMMAVEAGISLLSTHLPETGRRELEWILQIEWLRSGREPSDYPGYETSTGAPPKARSTAPPAPAFPTSEPRVIVADDDPLVRRLIRDTLQRADMVVIAEASNGREAVELALHYLPDVVVMDIVMPEMDGIEATEAIYIEDPSIPVVILTGATDDELALRSLSAGAVGHLTKEIELEALPRALRGVLAGEAPISRRLARILIETYRSEAPRPSRSEPHRSSRLTDRDRELVELLATDATTQGIAAELSVSLTSLYAEIEQLFQKLGVRSRREAMATIDRMRMHTAHGRNRQTRDA